MNRATEPATRRRHWLWWAGAALWWTLDGFTAATNYHRMGQATGLTWERAVQTAMISAWMWVPLTVLALWLADRFPLDRERWRRYLPLHLAGALLVCLVRALAVVALNPWVRWYAVLPSFGDVLHTSIANNLFLYFMLVGVGHALVWARRYRERDEQLARAELRSLKAQLHPHFLFNTLNTVNALVRTEPEAAERMIARLGVLLRHALDGAAAQEVPLEEELHIVRTYLEIEQVRFADRLRVEWRVDPATHGARVPHLLLQPLVENAIRHGIATQARPGTVTISAARAGEQLLLEVADDGPGWSGTRQGIGLGNTRMRLEKLYGARQQLLLGTSPAGGATVRISIPFTTHG